MSGGHFLKGSGLLTLYALDTHPIQAIASNDYLQRKGLEGLLLEPHRIRTRVP
jgi:hypothetical protein